MHRTIWPVTASNFYVAFWRLWEVQCVSCNGALVAPSNWMAVWGPLKAGVSLTVTKLPHLS